MHIFSQQLDKVRELSIVSDNRRSFHIHALTAVKLCLLAKYVCCFDVYRRFSITIMSLILATQLGPRFMSTSSRTAAGCAKNVNPKTKAMLERIIRVDHAGEFGAVRIYEGQIAVLGKTKDGPLLKEMLKEEEEHFRTFNKMIPEKRVRPTAFLPLWNVAGFALGAGTALMGKEAAMACTVAVETVIGGHYDNQIRQLMADGEDGTEKHKDMIKIISKFRDDELHHLDTGLEHDAEQAPMYNVLSNVIMAGCKAAIWASERV